MAYKLLIEIFEQKIKVRIAKVWGGSTSLTTGTSTGSMQGEKTEEEKMNMAAEQKVKYGNS